MKFTHTLALMVVHLLVTSRLPAVTPTAEELAEAQRWARAAFEAIPQARPAEPFMMPYLKSGTIERNRVSGRTFRIGGKEYERGLHVPSVGKIVIHLPAPGMKFNARVGMDGNDVGYYDRSWKASIVAVVRAGEKEVFRSEALREGMAAAPVEVNLAGSTELTLEIEDAGGTAAWDQADWAEARVTTAEKKTLWLDELPLGPMPGSYPNEPPFSFRYGDQPSRELLKVWEVHRSRRAIDGERAEQTVTYTDPRTGLVVRAVAILYRDFPVIEWTVYFRNTGSAATPILADIQSLDFSLERNGDGEFILHHNKGTPNSPTDYQPFETVLERKAEKRLAAAGGRPTNTDLCFFNLEWPGQGAIIGLGWPGQWAAQFTRDEGRSLRVRAGQELTHFKLLPGEEVRTPLVALLFWKGDWIHGQSLWRRWMIAHNLPRPGGKLPPPQAAAGSNRQLSEMQEANEENQKAFLDRYLEEGLKIDYWWMDAGWYPFQTGWWNTGTWEPDPKRFPRGLRAISDYAHAKGVKTLVWFEPERVYRGTWLSEKHPDWLLGHEGDNRLLDLGNPQAREWLTNHIDQLLTEQGIDLYRQDFNFDPLPFWRANDAEDRQGITEIRHVEGYLAYWDELRRRHPNMLIDSCASGGRRNDLETLRRAVPLWRSDYAYDTTAMQDFTYGMATWIPYFGTGVNTFDAYGFRSQMTPALALGWDLRRKDRDYNSLRRIMAQWRQVADFYYGDYYPLLPYTTSDKEWLAWQFDRPEEGDGMVQVFRRPECSYETARLKLRGLEPTAHYKITNLDATGSTEISGKELTEQGLQVSLNHQPDSAVITYKRMR